MGERGWLAERWQAPADITRTGACDDTWWVNEVCNTQPAPPRMASECLHVFDNGLGAVDVI